MQDYILDTAISLVNIFLQRLHSKHPSSLTMHQPTFHPNDNEKPLSAKIKKTTTLIYFYLVSWPNWAKSSNNYWQNN